MLGKERNPTVETYVQKNSSLQGADQNMGIHTFVCLCSLKFYLVQAPSLQCLLHNGDLLQTRTLTRTTCCILQLYRTLVVETLHDIVA